MSQFRTGILYYMYEDKYTNEEEIFELFNVSKDVYTLDEYSWNLELIERSKHSKVVEAEVKLIITYTVNVYDKEDKTKIVGMDVKQSTYTRYLSVFLASMVDLDMEQVGIIYNNIQNSTEEMLFIMKLNDRKDLPSDLKLWLRLQ